MRVAASDPVPANVAAMVADKPVNWEHVLREPRWAKRLTEADRRGLSPLFWSHANLYGRIEIDMHRHTDLGLAA